MPHTDFLADRNGFAFANAFVLTDAERTRLKQELALATDRALNTLGPLGLAARVLGLRDKLAALVVDAMPQHYGLCGGMAFAALDYLNAGEPLPPGLGVGDQPAVGQPLRDYLWRRLLDSWTLNGATFLEWKARLELVPAGFPLGGGVSAIRDRSRRAWSELRRSIDADRALPIGLVGAEPDPFLDHQVVAIGYDGSDDAGTIVVYDMNCPGQEQTIQVHFDAPALSAVESCPRGDNALRGFFCERYVPAIPPALI